MSIQFMAQMLGNGRAAQKLIASEFDPKVLRPWVEVDDDGTPIGAYVNMGGEAHPVMNATLRKDEWKSMDDQLVEIGTKRMRGVNYLIGKGLVYNLDGMSSTILENENISDMSDAVMDMDAAAGNDRDRVVFELQGLPLPITHKGFRLGVRQLNASRKRGSALDVLQAGVAGRKVAESIENVLYNGSSSYAFGGYTIYGFTDHPNRNTYTLTAHWDDSAATGDSILQDVLGMIQMAKDAYHFGPYTLHVPTGFWNALQEDYKAATDRSLMNRLLAIDSLEMIMESDFLTADNVILHQNTADVVRIVNGMSLQPVEWETEGGMLLHFKAMAIQVPQIRADQAGNSGVVHGSK